MVRTRLLDLLIARSYRRSDTPSFRLASGKLSNFYIDCRATTMRGEAMPLIGQVVVEQLPETAAAVGGLTMGADWIAAAAAYYGSSHGRPLDAFSVRKEPKQHGLKKWVEGCAAPGSKVVVVDDVVTTGGSTIDAIKRCREEGLEIVGVLALVDRQEEGGMENICREVGPDITVGAVFTRADLEIHAGAPSVPPRSAAR